MQVLRIVVEVHIVSDIPFWEFHDNNASAITLPYTIGQYNIPRALVVKPVA